MCSHSSPDRERRTVPLKRSTADSSIYAGPRWDSATSRITSRGVCSSPVASDRFYTLNYDEPHYVCFDVEWFRLCRVRDGFVFPHDWRVASRYDAANRFGAGCPGARFMGKETKGS